MLKTVSVLAGLALADAWGRIGHSTIGDLAQARLSDSAAAAVAELIGDQTLGDVANWADGDGKSMYKWSEPLHFINVVKEEPVECVFEPSRDCPDNECVAGSLSNFTSLLAANSGNNTENLMFVTHFAGDIHQPLHTAFADDKGGLKIDIDWCHDEDDDAAYDLHGLWDYSLIERSIELDYDNSQDVWFDALQTDIDSGLYAADVGRWTACIDAVGVDKFEACAVEYSEEGIALACGAAYRGVPDDGELCDQYRTTRLPVVRQRIAQAGVRLAALVNKVLGTD